MASTSPSRRAERKNKLRAEILAAASRMFAHSGYEAVTLRAIAEDIGYTHAVLYQHFPDKSHILAELCGQTFALLIGDFDRISEGKLTPKERLFATSRGLIDFCTAHPQHFRVVFFGPENRNGIRAGEYINAIGMPLFLRFEELFSAVAKVEGWKTNNVRLLAHTWWCSVLGLAMVLVIQGDLPGFSDHRKLIERTLATLWAGIQTAPARARRLAS